MLEGIGRWGCVGVLLLAGCATRTAKIRGDDAGGLEPDTAAEPDLAAPRFDVTAPDLALDAEQSPDLAADAAADASPDLAPDLEPDLAPDVAPDLAADRAPDVGPDLAPDVGPLPACGADPLATLPVPLADIAGIIPLGNLNPTAHTLPSFHTYVALGNSTGAVKTVGVRFPASGRVIRVFRYEGFIAGVTEYAVHFTVCNELFFYFNHLRNLDPDFLTQIGDFTPDLCSGISMRTCNKVVSIPVSGGAVFAQLPVQPNVQLVFDFGARDARLPSPTGFANVARYYLAPDGNDLRHVACPWNYFPAADRDAALALMGDPFSTPPVRRTTEPRCGTVVQDQAGTAQGNWFGYPTTGAMYYEPPPQEDKAVSLVHDPMYPARPVFSVGTQSNLGPGRYYFTLQASGRVNRDFSAVTAGSGVYCYETLTELNGQSQGPGIILVEATADSKLRLERLSFSSCGPGPWTFGPSVTTFER